MKYKIKQDKKFEIKLLFLSIYILVKSVFLAYNRPQKHTHRKRWERKVEEKKQFHCLRQRKQDLEVHTRCLLPRYLLVYVWYGFIDWHIFQELESKGDGLGLVCSWLSYGSVCTGSLLSHVVLRLFIITLSKKDSHTG